MDQCRIDLAQPVAFARFQMDHMAVKPAFAQQAEGLVTVQIIAGLGEQGFNPFDLVGLLGHMRLHQAIGICAPQRPHRLKLFGGRGGRESAA